MLRRNNHKSTKLHPEQHIFRQEPEFSGMGRPSTVSKIHRQLLPAAGSAKVSEVVDGSPSEGVDRSVNSSTKLDG